MAASREPQNLTPNDWYYEERGNLLLVHQVFDKSDRYLRTDQIKIPWRKIEASLKRVKAKARKRGASRH